MMTTATRTVRPVYCVIDHLYRDLDRARDVCAGRFEVAGVTLTIGDAPNWCDVAVDSDRERWIEWSKFYYGLDLASAFACPGDTLFLHTWERLIRSWLGNARRAGLEIPVAYDDSLQRAFEFAMYCHRPDGSMPALSDSDVGSYQDLLETAVELLTQTSLLYVATNGRRGAPPSRRCADFFEAGYFVQRSAFDQLSHQSAAHRSLIFDCGPIGDGGHGHYDALSIDVWCGRHLLVDPGRYTYDASSPWRQWFKGTAAHNTVCVDGLDQTGFHPGKPRRPARARLVTRYSSTLLDAVGGEVVSSEYDAIHRRHVFFIAGEYWIVIDELEAAEPHDYDLRFHLAPEVRGQSISPTTS